MTSSIETKTNQISSEIKNQLKFAAICRFGIILQVNEEMTLSESYTIQNLNENEKIIIFWFNDISRSTHIETIKISNN